MQKTSKVLFYLNVKQQRPRKTVVAENRNEVVDGRDKRSGGYGGVCAASVKAHGYSRAREARYCHGKAHSESDAACGGKNEAGGI